MANQIVYMKLELHGQAIQERQCSRLILPEGLWLVYVLPGLILNIVHFISVHVFYSKPPLFPDVAFVG